MAPVDEQIKIQYLLDTQQATKELETLSDLTKEYKRDLQLLQKQTGKTFDELSVGFRNAARANAEANKELKTNSQALRANIQKNNQAISQATKELKENEKQAKKNTQVFRELATTLKFVLITIVGGAFLDVWRSLTELFRESTEQAREFNKGIISLELGLRELQRRGADINFESLKEQITELRELFPFISEEQATKVFSKLSSRLAKLGVDATTLGELAKAAIGVSFVGSFEDSEAAADAFTDFISGNLTQSLRNAGFEVGEYAVKAKAASKGLDIKDLSEQEKALLRLEVVLDETSGAVEDAAKVSSTLEGALQTVEGRSDTATNSIGNLLLPLKLIGEQIKADLLKRLEELILLIIKIGPIFSGLVEGIKKGFSVITDAVATFNKFILGEIDADQLKETFKNLGSDIGEAFGEGFQEEAEKRARQLRPIFEKGLGLGEADPVEGEGGAEDVDLSKAGEIFRDLFAKILELQRDFERDSEELWEDYQRDLADITEKGKRKLLDIEEKFSEDLEDIEERRRERTEDANRNLAQGIEDVNRKFRQKLEDAQRDFREEEIRAERDFQEELRRLREDFLFDLDEAVRDRDARQIARLIKKFQLDKDRLLREREQDREDREKDFQDELEDIKRWRERRLQELRIEFQRRLEEIAKQAKREREEAEKRRQRAEEDLAEELKRQRDDRREAYDQQQADLEEALRIRIEELVHKTALEKEITSEAADFIANKFAEVFGTGGRLEKTFGEFLGIIENALAQAREDLEELNDLLDETLDKQDEVDDAKSDDTDESGNTNSSSDTSGFASGGTLVATKPTLAMFGEAQPEVAQFTTLSQMNSVASLNQPVPQLAEPSTMEGKMTLEVLLSPDLEARIVDSSVGAVADVVIGVQGSQPL